MLDNNTVVAEWYDIYGTRHIPLWRQLYFVRSIYAFLIGALCIGIIILLYKYKRFDKQLSPRAKALRNLRKIRNEYLHKRHTRTFYVHLTKIVKEYLSEEFSIDVKAKTDAELLDIVQSDSCSIDGVASLRPIFMHVERIKFAADTVETEKMRQDADLLDCFIELHHAAENNKQRGSLQS